MRKLVVSLLIVAAMMMGAVVGMAPFLKAAMTEPILDGSGCSSSNPCSNLFEFKPTSTERVSETITAVKAGSGLKIEILGYADKWDDVSLTLAIDAMKHVKEIYLKAGISKDRIVLAWANEWPNGLQAAEIHKETGITIDKIAKIAREDGLSVSDEQKKALFDKFLEINRKALLASEIDWKYQMQEDGIYIRLTK